MAKTYEQLAREQLDRMQCIGCQSGYHDPERRYPCLSPAEWSRRDLAIRAKGVKCESRNLACTCVVHRWRRAEAEAALA